MRLAVVAPGVVLVLALAGCIHMQRAPRDAVMASPPARCATLAARVTWMHVFGIVLGSAGSGAAGVAPAIDSTLGRDLLLGGGALCALGGAILGYLGGVEAAAFARECP